MRKFLWVGLCLALGLPVSGCTVARIYATSGNRISLTEVDPGAGEPFRITHRIMFDYTSAIDVQEILRDRYGSGHQFQNVTLKLKSDVGDFMINLVTFGLAQSKSFEISGDRLPKIEQAPAQESRADQKEVPQAKAEPAREPQSRPAPTRSAQSRGEPAQTRQSR